VERKPSPLSTWRPYARDPDALAALFERHFDRLYGGLPDAG
jgi:hypothetical protein